MSYGGYQQYGGNPYAGADSNPYAGDNPYAGGYGQQGVSGLQPPPGPPLDGKVSHQQAGPGGQQVQYVQAGPTVLSNPDFLSRVEAIKADIRTLTTHVGQIASMHQKTLSAPDNSASSAVEGMVTQTQVLNTSIKDQIKFLEKDAARSKDNPVKNTQINQLKSSFQKQLQEYRQEEASYEKRYREQIARQYRIVNPEASDAEVTEAANADWGNEGVFQTALKTNRSATANSVLGAVRARHNDIQKIEKTMIELQQLMEDLATAVVLQEEPIQQAEGHTENVKHDTEAGNVQLDKGIEHARRARKLKWWCFWIVVVICIIIALVVGLVVGLNNK
ncbi:t-SNARE [Polychaeton citri CBS 116435]|uniref:t-SNARE n=1 Tax=Polychaeton citri CBS 116435 TaxID=1314669 RepID=A0A9P4QEH4_9PEZI|nr:t-SNARE [Polychaeton citri CBS 116435]